MGNELILNRLCSNTHVRKAGDKNINSLHIELHMYLLALRFHCYPDLVQDLHNGSKLAVEKPTYTSGKYIYIHSFLMGYVPLSSFVQNLVALITPSCG